jgi:hypothetical protein
MRFDVTTSGTHTLDNAASGPLTLEAGATATQRGTGQVLLKASARIVNEGVWRVRDANGAINGANCCAVVAHFDNFGTVQVQPARTLTIANMGYLQRASGKVEPFGQGSKPTLRIAGGANELRGGVVKGVRLLLTDTAGLSVSGTVIFVDDGIIRQTDQSTVAGTASFSGPGTFEWSDGTITGQLTFGTAVKFVVDDPDTGGFRKYLYPNSSGGLLDIRGPSTFASSFDLVLYSVSGKLTRIVNHGGMTWQSGLIDYTGLAGTLVNDGTLKLQSSRHLRPHFTQTANETLKIVAATAGTKGQLVCDYNVKLDGTLALSRVGSAPVTAYSLLTGYTRSGTFANVTGLGAFPAGWHVAYTSTAVKLAH